MKYPVNEHGEHGSDQLPPAFFDYGWLALPDLRERRAAAEEFHEPYLRAHGLSWLIERSPEPPRSARHEPAH